MKNISLSADESLIGAACRRALPEGTTLNAKFRLWLESYVGHGHQADAALEAIQTLQGTISTEGRTFTREEMNQR
jgi:hypothetical protein